MHGRESRRRVVALKKIHDLNDAQSKGASVIELGNFDNQEINLMGTKVILNVNDDMEVMKNEVFGPLPFCGVSFWRLCCDEVPLAWATSITYYSSRNS